MSNYENFYSGSKSPFKVDYSETFPSYNSIARLGITTNPMVANQIEEVNKLMNQGMKTIEMGTIDPKVFETIPQEHLREINRLSKLTGEEITLHAPIQGMDPSGFGEYGWSPSTREEAERRLKEVVMRSHDLNPEGNIPVTVHASSLPAGDTRKGEMIVAVNQNDWQLSAFRREEKYIPGKGKVWTNPEKEMEKNNKQYWIDSVSDLIYYQNHAHAQLNEAVMELHEDYKPVIKGDMKREDLIDEREKLGYDALEFGRSYQERVDDHFKKIYHQAYKYGDEETRKKLGKINEEWKAAGETKDPLQKSDILKNSLNEFRRIISEKPPEIFKPVEEFAIKEASQTIGNVAFDAYDKFKDTAPIISLENFLPNMAFSSAEQLGRLVRESRNKFVEKAVSEGVSKSEAGKQAQKLIGATWDIGHLNMLRKGYPEEEAEKIMIEETRKIAPYVKHAHISDNFGHADTHLPPGMGNLPIKKLMEELEKKGFSGKQILEMGGYINEFKVSPVPYALENMNSPLYTMQASPTWKDARALYGSQGYFSGYGATLPEQHYSMYGGGFSTLPTELGGQTAAAGRRFGGTPME